jgi:hypothetical protein
MQHRGSAHPGAHIRRARGQISETLIVGELQFIFEGAVDFIDKLECLFQLQTGSDRLHAQVVLFIDHNAEGLPAIHHDRAAGALGSVLATDQMAFDKDLLLERGKILQSLRK